MLEDMRTLEGIDTIGFDTFNKCMFELEDMRTLEGIDTRSDDENSSTYCISIELEDMRTLEGIDTALINFLILGQPQRVRRYENP